LLVISLFGALRSIRLIPLFVLIAVPLLSRQFCAAVQARTAIRSAGTGLSVATRSILNGTIALCMALFVISHTVRVIQRQPEVQKQIFPEGAVAFLQSHPPPGPIFNHYDWGGYLIWRLYPNVRVFIDGRADVYGDQFFHEFADAYQFKDDGQRILQRWDVGTILVPAGSPIAAGLRLNPEWALSYEDSKAAIFTRI
jgi:hypothetical protein